MSARAKKSDETTIRSVAITLSDGMEIKIFPREAELSTFYPNGQRKDFQRVSVETLLATLSEIAAGKSDVIPSTTK